MESTRKRLRENPQVRRSQIVDEAIRIVGEFGYYGFTVQALAERCDLSNAGLLHYFGSKDSLLLALLDEIERREEEAIAPLLATLEDRPPIAGNKQARLLQVMEAMAARAAQAPEQTRFLAVLQAEALEPTHPAHDWFAQRDAETIALLLRLIDPATAKPHAMTRYLISILRGLTGQWLRDRDGFDLVQEFSDAAKRMLKNT